MYDIKSIETGEKTMTTGQNYLSNYFQKNSTRNKKLNKSNYQNSCSSYISSNNSNSSSYCNSISSTIPEENSLNLSSSFLNMSLRRRRIFQRQACLISIMFAFAFGLTLGVFVPMIGMSATFTSVDELVGYNRNHNKSINDNQLPILSQLNDNEQELIAPRHPVSDFPTIYELRQHQNEQTPLPAVQLSVDLKQQQQSSDTFPVSFVKNNNNEKELPVEEVFRNAFHLEQDKLSDDTMIVKKLDASDGSIKEFRVQRTSDGMFRKGPERRISKPSVIEQVLASSSPAILINDDNKTGNSRKLNKNSSQIQSIASAAINFVPIKEKNSINLLSHQSHLYFKSEGFIKDDIFWGDSVEKAIPIGFNENDAQQWNNYVKSSTVIRLENGCGRMQNRLVIFSDGKRACARYRQNTDQIQGELFSFYLGQLLNLTNLAPSAASVIDLDSMTWHQALPDIQNAQWKSTRPVVLTKWLPDLEPAGIPIAFQPLERHLNKFDVWNITLSMMGSLMQQNQTNNNNNNNKSASNNEEQQQQQQQNKKGLLERLGASSINNDQSLHRFNNLNRIVGSSESNIKLNNLNLNKIDKNELINSSLLNRLIELAQWSDLIVFDYLIANLDRVVNNLYNYQWNADIMAAPAHNLARQINSQLLVFLDNESGLLHGYRLLKKYEAYHGLLLDNLCVFRQPTIQALQNLRDFGAGHQLQELFERSTSHQFRDVLPSLPDKSIKILIDRIDRVLGQVQKCRDLFSNR